MTSVNTFKIMKNAIWFFIWILCLFIILGIAFPMINAASTIACFIGVILIIAFGLMSVSTICFTKFSKITFKKNKNENL